ncbi:MAG TPA: hemerythrin domain-containing protein [Rhizomicrobium sp.]|jgi:hemerythrin-like domain-containing protein|nr:hemerythrin domain-containing protein [Rhizomicrobium sp.]
MEKPVARRSVIAAGIAAPLAGSAALAAGRHAAKKPKSEESATGAVEDLMREHGVLRRCVLAYRECAGRLRIEPGDVDAVALNDAAKLFRSFGEDYHEKKLEEAHIFPRVRRVVSDAEAPIAILLAQHARGREITDYILSVTMGRHVAAADAEMLARAFDAFEVMYANHMAREDTIVFPAWKGQLSPAELAEMSNLFETIERAEFGGDGFADAVNRIAGIEDRLGLKNLVQFTAPPAPVRSPPAP